MSVDSSKVLATVLIGDTAGVTSSKVVAYILMEPGTEAGAPTPERKQGFTYAQVLRPSE